MSQQKFQESLVNKIIDGTPEKNRGFYSNLQTKALIILTKSLETLVKIHIFKTCKTLH